MGQSKYDEIGLEEGFVELLEEMEIWSGITRLEKRIKMIGLWVIILERKYRLMKNDITGDESGIGGQVK